MVGTGRGWWGELSRTQAAWIHNQPKIPPPQIAKVKHWKMKNSPNESGTLENGRKKWSKIYFHWGFLIKNLILFSTIHILIDFLPNPAKVCRRRGNGGDSPIQTRTISRLTQLNSRLQKIKGKSKNSVRLSEGRKVFSEILPHFRASFVENSKDIFFATGSY